MEWIKGLEKWRGDRKITQVSGEFDNMIAEELEEYQDANNEHDRVDAIADIMVLCTNELELMDLNTNDIIHKTEVVCGGSYEDVISEMIENYVVGDDKPFVITTMLIKSIDELQTMGYIVSKVMNEVVKEISSRQQDPEQAVRDWSGEKWQKWREQPLGTLYQADYSGCKI